MNIPYICYIILILYIILFIINTKVQQYDYTYYVNFINECQYYTNCMEYLLSFNINMLLDKYNIFLQHG